LPEEVYSSIGKTTLFLQNTENGNRIGFVAETRNELELIQTMKVWEKQAFQDTKPLFELFGFEQDPLVSYFLSALEKKPAFRYQTFSKQDLGICYLITANYFIWTTSYETMEKVIENLGDLE